MKKIIIFSLSILFCTVNVITPQYYRLIEKERKIYLGLKAMDSVVAQQYIELPSAYERKALYEKFWKNKEPQKRTEFEERIEYAFKNFGRYAPLSDERIPIYIKYGQPTKRERIIPQKIIGTKTHILVKPAEVWTYRTKGLIFDFVRKGRAYKLLACSSFGDSVKIPYLMKISSDTLIDIKKDQNLDFNLSYGRFRQQENLTRLELYISLDIDDTTGLSLYRRIRVRDKNDSIISESNDLLKPFDAGFGTFYDEINLWLKPEKYQIEISYADIKNHRFGQKELAVSLIEYQNDAKEISDLVPALLIDHAVTREKFDKPIGRMIPLIKPVLPIHQPFYLYVEVYNLKTRDGQHHLRTTYEVYNKEKMHKEIVDIMIDDWFEPGDVAYLGAHYHPMDLPPGHYIIVLRAKDQLSGKERTAITEFKLKPTE